MSRLRICSIAQVHHGLGELAGLQRYSDNLPHKVSIFNLWLSLPPPEAVALKNALEGAPVRVYIRRMLMVRVDVGLLCIG
jgi:hypothetical protein